MLTIVKKFAADENGASAIEYALIASGIFLAIVSVIGQVGSGVSATFDKVNAGL